MLRGVVRAILLVLVLTGASGLVDCTPDRWIVDNEGLRGLEDEGARIVDVRTASEFAAGSIPGAEHVPLPSLTASAEQWDRTEPIVLYCATGARSAEAAQVLRSMGFEQVYDLGAGFAAWDGEVRRPGVAESAEAAPSDSAGQPSGLPVFYEFYTDW